MLLYNSLEAISFIAHVPFWHFGFISLLIGQSQERLPL
jgi:hypothetical protein